MSYRVQNELLTKLNKHILLYKLKKFSILFHGGEPLLFGKKRLFDLCKALKEIGELTACRIDLAITTNGVLIDEEYASLFSFFNISVTISIDGDESVHDQHRIGFDGQGSYKKVIAALPILKKYAIDAGILAVCDPSSSPEKLYSHFTQDLKLLHFDVLIPDFTHDDADIKSIAKYYTALFDLWYDDGKAKVADIRILRSFVLGLLGYNSASEGLGYGPIQTLTMLTDGSLEPLDVLRISGHSNTKTGINIFSHEIQDVTADPVWVEAFEASLNLNKKCVDCEYKMACGGGFLPSRWSNQNRFDNPNVYCNDLKHIFNHIWERISEDIFIRTQDHRKISLAQALH